MVEEIEVGEARTGIATPGLWSPSEKLSPRIKRQRAYYFLDEKRPFQNDIRCYTTGIPNDHIETPFTLAEGLMGYLAGITGLDLPKTVEMGALLIAEKLALPKDFWDQPLIVRRAIVFEATLRQIPVDILPDELIVGGRFCTGMSAGLNEKELEEFNKRRWELAGRQEEFANTGLAIAMPAQGHLIEDAAKVLTRGFKGIKEEAEERLRKTASPSKKDFYRAAIVCCDAVREFAHRYADEARRLAKEEKDSKRKEELVKIAENCDQVPYNPARTFWEALQATWMQHMLIMIAENYMGPGTSPGRLDQDLYPFYKKDIEERKMTREWAKELIQSFFIKFNYAYDAMPAKILGKHGRHAGDGQMFVVGGCGPVGEDQANELSHLMLDSFVELNMLEPKLNVRIHSGSPDGFLMKLADITRKTQGSPFITNFDKVVVKALENMGVTHEEACDYAPVGCLENSLRGTQAGTVDVQPFSHVKPLELVLNRGKDLLTGKPITFDTGDPAEFKSFDEVMDAYKKQLRTSVKTVVDLMCDYHVLRGKYLPVPYLSLLMKGCTEKGIDTKDGGQYYAVTTFNGCGIATVADALAAIKKIVFDDKKATMKEVVEACRTNWKGKEDLRRLLLNKAPKFGNDDDYVDLIAREIMTFWANDVKQYITPNGKRFRSGYLSWNLFIWHGSRTMATPDGRKAGDHLSNGVGPHQGRDTQGPTATIKSVGKLNLALVPSGGSFTWTINPATMKTDEQLKKFVGLMRAYNELEGSAWQTNCISKETLRDAQKHPENFSNLLVRITGYNAYFTTIGRALQEEVIARTEHAVG
nr:pyruvate formate lyase family protein [Candidatus Njordarchaeota archaeon]